MSIDTKRTGLELRSLVKSSGELELSLVRTVIPTPAPDEVVVRIEAFGHRTIVRRCGHEHCPGIWQRRPSCGHGQYS